MTRLHQCHPDLKRLFLEVVKRYDNSIITGHRMEAEQDEMFNTKKSKVEWPDSKHNKNPSMAVDAVRYNNGIQWDDTVGHYHFAGYVLAIADMLNIKIRCGANWDGDSDLHDQTFNDLIHFELIED